MVRQDGVVTGMDVPAVWSLFRQWCTKMNTPLPVLPQPASDSMATMNDHQQNIQASAPPVAMTTNIVPAPVAMATDAHYAPYNNMSTDIVGSAGLANFWESNPGLADVRSTTSDVKPIYSLYKQRCLAQAEYNRPTPIVVQPEDIDLPTTNTVQPPDMVLPENTVRLPDLAFPQSPMQSQLAGLPLSGFGQVPTHVPRSSFQPPHTNVTWCMPPGLPPVQSLHPEYLTAASSQTTHYVNSIRSGGICSDSMGAKCECLQSSAPTIPWNTYPIQSESFEAEALPISEVNVPRSEPEMVLYMTITLSDNSDQEEDAAGELNAYPSGTPVAERMQNEPRTETDINDDDTVTAEIHRSPQPAKGRENSMELKKNFVRSKCPTCKKRFANKAALKRHKEKCVHQLVTAKYRCVFCNQHYRFHRLLTRHLQRYHKITAENVKTLMAASGDHVTAKTTSEYLNIQRASDKQRRSLGQ